MYPMKMTPSFKDYLWGGERLTAEFGKKTDLRPVAESWEISCHPDGESIVSHGGDTGKTLREVLAENPAYSGTKCSYLKEFPLLVKLIDAKQDLSVQVHPGDDYARRVEGQQGKNEMWYVVDADPGAQLILGCREGVTLDRLRKGIQNGTLLEMVNRVPVKAGDCFQIPAGMLHAIGGGILIAEIQQNSNVTYRVFDYNRVGAAGKLRPLHVDRALEVICPELREVNRAGLNALESGNGYSCEQLTGWDYFSVSLLEIEEQADMHCGAERFQCLIVLKGDFVLGSKGGSMPVKKGDSVFIPAGLGDYRLHGNGQILFVHM